MKKRSGKIVILGLAWAFMGIASIVSEIESYSDSVLLNKLSTIFPTDHGIFLLYFLSAFMSVNSPQTLLFNCLFYLLFIISGIGILKLKPWARNIAEFLTWYILSLFILQFAFPFYHAFTFETKDAGALRWFLFGMLSLYFIVLLIGTAWAVFLLWLVRCRDIKEQFKFPNEISKKEP